MRAARENLFHMSALASDSLLAILDVPWFVKTSP